MTIYLDDDAHERLWRICDALVSTSGARAAMVCDAGSGSVLVSVGDTSASGAVSGVESLGPGERLIHGEAGQIYGVEVPGGALLAVLHDAGVVDRVRAAATRAVSEAAHLLSNLPPPPPPPAWPPVPHDAHGHVIETPKPARKKKKAPARKKALEEKKAAGKKAPAKKKPAAKRKVHAKKKPAPKTKRAPARGARSKSKRRRRT